MLKTIVGLQKRVKALTKGMQKEKVEPVKGQQETSNRSHRSEALSGQESAEKNNNTDSASQRTATTDRELQTNHMITDKSELGNEEGKNQK